MPDTGKPREVNFEDYRKAMEERGQSDQKQIGRVLRLLFLFFALAIAGIILKLTGAKAFFPFVVSAGGLLLLVFMIVIIKALRCPACGRFFPKGPLHQYTEFAGTAPSMDSGGNSYTRTSTTHVFWTECKYCGHRIWILK